MKKSSQKATMSWDSTAESVKLFEPDDKIKEPNSDASAAGAALVKQGLENGAGSKTFIYVNNRLEGNALETIDAMLAGVVD